ELPRFVEGNKADRSWTILEHDFIRQPLRLLNLLGRNAGGFEIDGAALRAHVEAARGHLEQPNESRRKYMLSRMLLHVVATPGRIDRALNCSAYGEGLRDEVEDAPIVFVGDFCHRNLPAGDQERAGIVHLSAAGRIKSSAIQNESRFRID